MSEQENPPAAAQPAECVPGRVMPLAWGQYGDPINVPPAASGWRVRRLVPGARGGAPEVLYADGLPLMIPIEATADDLRALLTDSQGEVGGKYRLEAIDINAQTVEGVPFAFSVISAGAGGRGQPKPASDDMLARLLESNQKLVEANVAALEKVTLQMATYTQATSSVMEAASRVVNAADSAGVTRRELAEGPPVQVLAPYVPGALEPAAKPEDTSANWIAQVAQHGPAILAMATQMFQAVKNQMAAQAGASQGAPPAASPSGGAQ